MRTPLGPSRTLLLGLVTALLPTAPAHAAPPAAAGEPTTSLRTAVTRGVVHHLLWRR